MDEIRSAIAEYIFVLRDSLANCHRAEDRDKYNRHLAAAAMMLAEVCQGYPMDKLLERLKQEERSYGWDYLSYKEGEAAEEAFSKIVKLIRKNATDIKSRP
jgi:hypothetical protein